MRAEIRGGERARERTGAFGSAHDAPSQSPVSTRIPRAWRRQPTARGAARYSARTAGKRAGGRSEEHALVVERADVLDAGEALDRGGRLAGGGTSDAARGVHEEHARRDTRGGHMLSRRSRVERTGLGDHARATPTPKPNGDESSRVESSTTAHPPASRSATMSVAPRGARDHERMRGVESRARRE